MRKLNVHQRALVLGYQNREKVIATKVTAKEQKKSQS